MDLAFRPLTDDDLPLLHGWLNEPGVVRWWEDDDLSWEGVVAHYGSDGRDPDTTHHLAEVDGSPIGWVQCWPAETGDDESRPWADHGLVLERTIGIDYLLGTPGDRGRGIGSLMIATFVEDVAFAEHPERDTVAAGPYLANEASWRALARAGFTHVADLVHDGDDEPCRLMARRRTVEA